MNIDKNKIPQHVAIIMDGNGRWAQSQGEERTFGHKNGVEAVREAISGCREIGVQYLTLYAFSTENWNRPKEEVDFLMNLLVDALTTEVKSLIENDIRIETIGNINDLPERSLNSLIQAKQDSKHCKSLTLILALNYGSKKEILDASRQIALDVSSQKLDINTLDETVFSKYLNTADFPNPDILIRTSEEYRLSNFLLWQLAYAEFFFLPIFWPEFKKENLFECISQFQSRERRFGKTGEQVK